MDLISARAALTVVMLLLFVGIVVWAYSSKRKKKFDDAARSVLEDDGTPETEQRHRGR